jgi:hypothetical protein
MPEIFRTLLKIAAIVMCLALLAGFIVLAGLMFYEWQMGR